MPVEVEVPPEAEHISRLGENVIHNLYMVFEAADRKFFLYEGMHNMHTAYRQQVGLAGGWLS